MKTKKELIDDIILRVTKGAPSDDLELEPRQIAFWFDLAAASIVPQMLNSNLKKNQGINPIFIQVEDNIVPLVEDVTMLSDCDDRVYIVTSKQPLELMDDAAVIRIRTEEGLVVNKVPLDNLDTLNSMPFSKPTRDNLLHTRINDRIYIHGLSPKHVNLTKFSVWYVPQINVSGLADTDYVKLTDEVLETISDAVEQRAWRELGGQADDENDAEDDTDPKK